MCVCIYVYLHHWSKIYTVLLDLTLVPHFSLAATVGRLGKRGVQKPSIQSEMRNITNLPMPTNLGSERDNQPQGCGTIRRSALMSDGSSGGWHWFWLLTNTITTHHCIRLCSSGSSEWFDWHLVSVRESTLDARAGFKRWTLLIASVFRRGF